ncbi:MAG: hypothetical protein MUO76_06745, partial [Anaerolineaceae bacterium]|nr:hypothetical protein [Anaerolineaceae bacterium]
MDLMRWTYRDPSLISNIYRSPGHREKAPEGPYDEVLDRCDMTIDPDERNECVKEAQILLMEYAMGVPILSNWGIFAVQNFVRDYTLNYFGGRMLVDVWLEK